MIPKIYHRMWLDKNDENRTDFPEKYSEYYKSFSKYNPEFEIIEWNTKKVRELFINNKELTKYYDFWNKLKQHIQKCDFARYAVLYIYGGIYVDLDFEFFKNLTPLLNRELILVKEFSWRDSIFNGAIGCTKKHPFFLEFLEYIITRPNINMDRVFQTTGTAILYEFYNKYYKNIELTDGCDIIPLSFSAKIAKPCMYRMKGINLEYNINPRDINSYENYQQYMNSYMATKWNEGTGWKNKDKELILFLIFFLVIAFTLFLIVNT